MTDLNVIILRQTWFGTWNWWLRYPSGGGIGSASPFRRRTDALMRAIDNTNDPYMIQIEWANKLMYSNVDGINELTETWARQ